MRRSLTLAAMLLVACALATGPAFAKSKKHWSRYDATLVCDVAATTVVVHNPSKVDITVIARLTDAMGDTQQALSVPAEGLTSFDCTSTGVNTTGILSFEGPGILHATATYVGAGGSVDVERLVPIRVSGRHGPRDDSDTGDSDSAAGDPNPS